MFSKGLIYSIRLPFFLQVAINVLLPQWLQFYQQNFLSFIDALKLDEDDESIERFVRLSKQALLQMFPSMRFIS